MELLLVPQIKYKVFKNMPVSNYSQTFAFHPVHIECHIAFSLHLIVEITHDWNANNLKICFSENQILVQSN